MARLATASRFAPAATRLSWTPIAPMPLRIPGMDRMSRSDSSFAREARMSLQRPHVLG
jgi:hypothetical protein